jgi:hypothetical protein
LFIIQSLKFFAADRENCYGGRRRSLKTNQQQQQGNNKKSLEIYGLQCFLPVVTQPDDGIVMGGNENGRGERRDENRAVVNPLFYENKK